MKKIISITLLIICFHFSNAQEKPDYLQKSKNQKTAAWLLLGGGAALTLTGFAIDKGEMVQENWFWYNEYKNDGLKAGLVLSGLAISSGSIPLFIIAARNKSRSMELSVKAETVQTLSKVSYVIKKIPSISLKINL